jgi:hypothetical protein
MKTKNTVQKVLNELKSEKPDLSYIRGLLEGLVEDEEYIPSKYLEDKKVITPLFSGDKGYENNIKSDEQEIIPAALRPGPVANLS